MFRLRATVITLLLACLYLSTPAVLGHPDVPADSVEIAIVLDRPDQIYKLEETAAFTINLRRGGKPVQIDSVRYRLSNDGEATLDEGWAAVRNGIGLISGALRAPGFLRLDVTYGGPKGPVAASAAAAFEPTRIVSTARMPDDLDLFWSQGKAELLRVPIDPVETEQPELSGEGVRVVKISLGCIEGSRVYGYLSLPETAGPHPAVLYIPGAGVGPLKPISSYPQQGLAVFHMTVHGVDIDLPADYYRELREGILRDYPRQGWDDPYRFFYRRVILGAFRVFDYLAARPDIDADKLGVAGSSQGGALSLLVAGLDSRVKAATSNVPAMCDHTGHYYGRPSGWPRLWREGDRTRLERTFSYFDAAVVASRINAPVLMAVGFVDDACPPTTVYAAYNSIPGPKSIDNFPRMGHAFGPGWQDNAVKWMAEKLQGAGR